VTVLREPSKFTQDEVYQDKCNIGRCDGMHASMAEKGTGTIAQFGGFTCCQTNMLKEKHDKSVATEKNKKGSEKTVRISDNKEFLFPVMLILLPWDPGISTATAWGQVVFLGSGNVMTRR
jgi:hypothetical protein